MVRVACKWVLGAAVAATGLAVVARALRPSGGTGSARGPAPSITGDTWAPVPTNPDRTR